MRIVGDTHPEEWSEPEKYLAKALYMGNLTIDDLTIEHCHKYARYARADGHEAVAEWFEKQAIIIGNRK